MILRRFMQHVKEQNWFAVGLDVIVVIVGIFLGMQVQQWYEVRKENELETEYLTLLTRDFIAINKSLDQQLDYEQFVIEASKKALTYINNQEQKINPVELGQLLTQMDGTRTLSLQSPVFTELQSTGRISIIRDIELRNSIMEYFDSLVRTERIVDHINKSLVESYTVFLRDSGIGFVPFSESQCSDLEGNVPCLLSESLLKAVDGERTHSAELILGTSLSETFKVKLRAQVTYRAIAADSIKFSVTGRLDDTKSIIDKIDDYSIND